MSSWTVRVCVTAVLMLLSSACVQTVYKVKVNGSEQAIRNEAARNKSVDWKLMLGAGRIDDMAVHSTNRLFVSMRRDQTVAGGQHAMLVDSRSGRMLWQYDPVSRQGEYARVLMLAEMIVLRFDYQGATTLVAVSATNGQEMWSLPAVKGSVSYQMLPGENSVLAAVAGDDGVTLSAYDLATAHKRWERQFATANHPATGVEPLVSGDSVWAFYNGVEKLSIRDGSTLFRRGDLILGDTGATPRFDGSSIYIMDRKSTLYRLSTATGKSDWFINLAARAEKWNNIYPLGDHVYLRGSQHAGKELEHKLLSVSARRGGVSWQYANKDPVVSNLIEHKGRLYFASASRIVALELTSGASKLSIPVTNSGRTYPVELRRFDDSVVFIGELIVAALDVNERRLSYKHGFDPVTRNASLTALDGHLEKLESQLGQMQGKKSTYGVLSSLHTAEAAHWQEQSNYYADKSSSGSSILGSTRDRSAMVQMSDQFSRDASRLAFQAAMSDLGNIIADAIKTQALQEEIESEKFLRRTIYMAYNAMVADEYLYRPVLVYRSRDEQFVSLAVIHLPTGQIRRTSLSAPHDDLGLWALLDPETGIAYHNGVGMDPSDYSYTGKPAGAAEYMNSFLIAQPVSMPK